MITVRQVFCPEICPEICPDFCPDFCPDPIFVPTTFLPQITLLPKTTFLTQTDEMTRKLLRHRREQHRHGYEHCHEPAVTPSPTMLAGKLLRLGYSCAGHMLPGRASGRNTFSTLYFTPPALLPAFNRDCTFLPDRLSPCSAANEPGAPTLSFRC